MIKEAIEKMKMAFNDEWMIITDNFATANAITPALIAESERKYVAMLVEDLSTRTYMPNTSTGGVDIMDKFTMYFFTFPSGSDIAEQKAYTRDYIVQLIDENLIPLFVKTDVNRLRSSSTTTITFPHSLFDDEEVGVQLVISELIGTESVCTPSVFEEAYLNPEQRYLKSRTPFH